MLLERRWALVALLNATVGCDATADFSFSSSTGDEPSTVASPTQLTGSVTFVEPGDRQSVVTAQAIVDSLEQVKFESANTDYGETKRFIGASLSAVLKKYVSPESLGTADQVRLTATDGYSVSADLETLLSSDAFLAFGHQQPGDFEPVGDRAADPRPFYLIWRGASYADEKKHPRPWGVVKVELLSAGESFPRARPTKGFGEFAVAKQGFEIFTASCIRCHSINQDGGKLGPDLNVPQNILAYRPEEQVRAYIKNPETFRYSAMPAHPDLSTEQLDALVAYLRLMGKNQLPPRAKK